MLKRVEFAANTAVLPHPKKPWWTSEPSMADTVFDLYDTYGGQAELSANTLWPVLRGSFYSPDYHLRTEARRRQTKAEVTRVPAPPASC